MWLQQCHPPDRALCENLISEQQQVRLVSVKAERPNHPSRGGGVASQGGQPAGGGSASPRPQQRRHVRDSTRPIRLTVALSLKIPTKNVAVHYEDGHDLLFFFKFNCPPGKQNISVHQNQPPKACSTKPNQCWSKRIRTKNAFSCASARPSQLSVLINALGHEMRIFFRQVLTRDLGRSLCECKRTSRRTRNYQRNRPPRTQIHQSFDKGLDLPSSVH